MALGARMVGGCCGTTPAHIRAMRERLASHLPAETLPPGRRGARARAARPPERRRRAETEEPALLRKLREKFVVSVEIDPPRGINTQKVMEGARLMAERGVDAINIADSPDGAHPHERDRRSPTRSTRCFPRIEIILHFTTRDRNLMGLQSDLLGAHALGLRNILCLTGDPPSLGDYPNMTAVYDTDSVGLIRHRAAR